MSDPLSELLGAWDAAQNGHGSVMWVSGYVGTGKSTLLGEFFRNLDQEPEETAVIFCRCGDASIVSASDHGELEALIAQIAEGVRAFSAPDDPTGALQEVSWCLPGIDFLSAAVELSSLNDGAKSAIDDRIESHLGVLFDVARLRPICLILDDIQRTDQQSQRLLDAIDKRLSTTTGVQILIIASDTLPLTDPSLSDSEGHDIQMNQERHARTLVYARSRDRVSEFVLDRLSDYGEPNPDYLKLILDTAGNNLLVAKALIKVSEHYQALNPGELGGCSDPDLQNWPQFSRLEQLARGQLPSLPANLQADLEQASIFGLSIHAEIMAELWSVSLPAAELRLDALMNTGMVFRDGGGLRFLSEELTAQFRDQIPDNSRKKLHRKFAQILRARARSILDESEKFPNFVDVTDTWRDSQKRAQISKKEFDLLWTAAHHFSKGDRATQAAEAAVSLVERLFDTSGGHPYLAGHAGRREDRERRHRIYAVLTEAENQITRAIRFGDGQINDQELLSIKVRLYNVKSRFKEVMGDFMEAKRYSELAVELSTGRVPKRIRVEAIRIQLEVNYASGDAHAARLGISRLLSELEDSDTNTSVKVLSWLAEAVGRWEWYGLQEKLFGIILQRLAAMGAESAVNRVQLEWLAASAQAEQLDRSEQLVENFIREAKTKASQEHFAEQLARFASELNHARVDTHFDLLSGEYYSADLLNSEASLHLMHLAERLTLVQGWFREAERLASNTDAPVTQLRVAAIELGTIYESRERLFELLERWRHVAADQRPSALQDVVHILEDGAYSTDQIERLTLFIIGLSRDLELYQIIGDTIYEALERETPSIMEEASQYFQIAEAAYQEVDDAYGLLTLLLVRMRQLSKFGGDPTTLTARAESILNQSKTDLTSEQRAFVHYRLGDHYLQTEPANDSGIQHLEQSINLYDYVGDMTHVQTIADVLREIYKRQGDLSRYRSIRERFSQLDLYNDGVDPLGLELRIEHLLNLARNEEDEIKAIEMVEECVQLFSRVPDGTTRIDECFVEISKICRRRAERAETEAGHQDWLQRSLEAVQIAVSINRSLGNYFRVFEEYHELFEDLLGLGLYEEYLRQRNENRELAFAVGNVTELVYLFEEHLQFDPDQESPMLNAIELRGFYEGLSRYIQGIGAHDYAEQLRRSFVTFLIACGEAELAAYYRSIPTLGYTEPEADDETENMPKLS